MVVVVCKAAVARVIHCGIQPPRLGGPKPSGRPDQVRLVPRSRPYTLKSDHRQRRGGNVIVKMMMRSKRRKSDHQEINGGDDQKLVDLDYQEEDFEYMLENLYESIEIFKKGYVFEIITGRLAMVLLAMTMSVELATGDSVLKVIDAQEIIEGLLGCLAATTCATFFARSSVTQNKIGRIFTVSCNAFFDALIDNVLDGLFTDNDSDEPSDNNLN